MLGFLGRTNAAGKLQGTLLADIGGFGVGSDLTWEFMPALSYRFSDAVSLALGYRWLDIDFDDSDFEFDAAQFGWLLGLGIAL